MDYLLRVAARGYSVARDLDDFVLLTNDGEVRIRPVDGLWRVSRMRMRVLSTYGDATNESELDDLMRSAFGGSEWLLPPTTGRLSADMPASNLRTISRLIGTATIKAVFDTYLDNQGLEHLIQILSFGDGQFGSSVRLLGTTATANRGNPPRLSKAGVDAWARQLGITVEARFLPQANEHRRFILLNQRQSLILGPSLNSIHKNEAVSVDSDVHDRPFFDQQWAVASPLL